LSRKLEGLSRDIYNLLKKNEPNTLRWREIVEELYPKYTYRYDGEKNFGVAVSQKLRQMRDKYKLIAHRGDRWGTLEADFSEKRTFISRTDFNLALKHSIKLILGLEAILAEDMPMWLEEENESKWTFRVETEGRKLGQFAYEHLSSGYPSVDRLLMRHRRLNGKIRRDYERGKISKSVFNLVYNAVEDLGETLSESEEKQAEEIMKKKWGSYKDLAAAIRGLEEKIQHGTPLAGKCQLCPRAETL
jgi:hypothetical protein